MRRVSSCVVGVLGFGLLVAVPVSAQTTIHACVQNRQGQLRVVASPDACRPSETPVQWQSGADLSEISTALDAVRARLDAVEGATEGLPALAARLAALEPLPAVVPLSLNDAVGRGNALGCDLTAVEGFEKSFRVSCNEFADVTEPQSGTQVRLSSPPDMAYTYDGLYLCGISSGGLRSRGETFRLSIYFHEVDVVGGEVTMQRRDNSLDMSRRGLKFVIPATALTPLEVDAASAGRRPCVTLRFSEGEQDGGQPPLPGHVWVPTAEAAVFVSMPPMLPATTAQFGDFLTISQVGLTVAGRRPLVP